MAGTLVDTISNQSKALCCSVVQDFVKSPYKKVRHGSSFNANVWFATLDASVRNPTASLRGAKRRGNLMNIQLDTRLPLGSEPRAEQLRFAHNDN
jgi:hypothetical protein